jgi:glycerol uptake facilitator-like aquaporin
MSTNLWKQCVAEFIGTFALIFIGVGAINNNTPALGMGLLGVALAHGLTIAVMASATGGISGGTSIRPLISACWWEAKSNRPMQWHIGSPSWRAAR